MGMPKRWVEPTAMSAPHSTRRDEQAECQGICGRDHQRARRRGASGKLGMIVYCAVGARVLDQYTGPLALLGVEVRDVVHHDVDAQTAGPGLHHTYGLWVAVVGHEERGSCVTMLSNAHHHRFRGRGSLVEQ